MSTLAHTHTHTQYRYTHKWVVAVPVVNNKNCCGDQENIISKPLVVSVLSLGKYLSAK